ncbi:MAG: rRNA maturation RNase YbeY [Candidatus Aminicenantes bacterium]|nr:rRNA maturation RNase YbeY [Candidatus Aminicenantes bacterium]
MEVLVKSHLQKPRIAPNKIKELTKRILRLLRVQADEVSVVFVSDEEMRHYNQTYRNVPEPTDVLSFPLEGLTPEGRRNLGDIIISLETASRQAEELGHSLEREVKILLVHGLIHLLGYDHTTDQGEMEAKEREVLKSLEEDSQPSSGFNKSEVKGQG